MYDITNGWSFDGIDRWIREIDEVIPFNPFGVDKQIQEMHEMGPVLCPILCLFAFIPEKDHCPIVQL